jgi:hypothetical protein
MQNVYSIFVSIAGVDTLSEKLRTEPIIFFRAV